MRDWGRDRFDWMQQIMAELGRSGTAKLLAAVIATRFASAETGECYPSKAALAAAVGRSERMVQIAIRELEEAGWLDVSRGRGRGRASTYRLAFPVGCEPEKRRNVVPLSEARAARKRRNERHEKGEMGFSPILEPSIEPRARTRGGDRLTARSDRRAPEARPRGRAIPEEFVACPKRLAAWSDWLARKGWPSLDVMGLRGLRMGEAGASLPFGWPPSDREAEDTTTAEAFFALKVGQDRAPRADEGRRRA